MRRPAGRPVPTFFNTFTLCPSEYGPSHSFILLSTAHGTDGRYGCQRCPETRTGADLDAVPMVEYHVDSDGAVIRFLKGEWNETVTARPLRLELAHTVAAALNDAVRKGADHGACALTGLSSKFDTRVDGESDPGHTVYECSVLGRGHVFAWKGGKPETAVADIRPRDFAEVIARELNMAFDMGALAEFE